MIAMRAAWPLAAILMVLARGTHGQTADYAPIALTVACGALSGPVCSRVLPMLGARAAQTGLALKPAGSASPPGAIEAVCGGLVAAAIVARDVAVRWARQNECRDRYGLIGHPLFPLYALLVVRTGAPRRSSVGTIVADTDGAVTYALLASANPDAVDTFDAASERVVNGSIDGFFTVRPLVSGLINRIRTMNDGRGRPLFEFVDVRIAGDSGAPCVWRAAALDFGGAAPVTTLSTDAVLILGTGFRDAHARGGPPAADALAAAIDAASAAILAETRSPRDWRGAGASCH
jgi:hypothetical protein